MSRKHLNLHATGASQTNSLRYIAQDLAVFGRLPADRRIILQPNQPTTRTKNTISDGLLLPLWKLQGQDGRTGLVSLIVIVCQIPGACRATTVAFPVNWPVLKPALIRRSCWLSVSVWIPLTSPIFPTPTNPIPCTVAQTRYAPDDSFQDMKFAVASSFKQTLGPGGAAPDGDGGDADTFKAIAEAATNSIISATGIKGSFENHRFKNFTSSSSWGLLTQARLWGIERIYRPIY
jgi:hypothetical protein